MAKTIESKINSDKDKNSLFYFYHNWRARQKNKIHRGHCNHCRFGFGQRTDQIRGLNGVWIGPFDNLQLAEEYINNYRPELINIIDYCGHCHPNQ